MKKEFMLLVCAFCLCLLSAVSCSSLGYIIGTGPIVTQTYDYQNFTNIEISSAFEYNITPAESYSISISTHENILSNLDIRQTGSTLYIGLKPVYFSNDCRADITLPLLKRLKVSGASHGIARGFKTNEKINLEVSGASHLNMDIESGKTDMNVSGASTIKGLLNTQELHMQVSGASHCYVIGSADLVSIEISGASQMDSPEFVLQNASVNLSGASQATVNTRNTLNVDMGGASTLNYLGNPILSKVNITGASKMNSK